MTYGKTPEQVIEFYQEAMRRVDALPGVSRTAFGNVVPWRDPGFGSGLEFSGDGHAHAPGEDDPRAQWRIISPGFFASLGVPILAGRDFNDDDRQRKSRSLSSARRWRSACSPVRIPLAAMFIGPIRY